jgi:arylsulfatase A-like enzyme
MSSHCGRSSSGPKPMACFLSRHAVATARPDEPWAHDIWADGSPYVAAARTADVLLGQFLDALSRERKLDDSLLVLLSDGQAGSGWHPVQSVESALAPVVFVGPGSQQAACCRMRRPATLR